MSDEIAMAFCTDAAVHAFRTAEGVSEVLPICQRIVEGQRDAADNDEMCPVCHNVMVRYALTGELVGPPSRTVN